jgi:hypothetical protein
MTGRLDTIAATPPSERLKFENTPEPAVLRIKQRKRGWVPISRALIDDSRLQFDTRDVANWLIAKSDGWQLRVGALPYLLQQRAGPGERMGRDRVRRMLRELERGLRSPMDDGCGALSSAIRHRGPCTATPPPWTAQPSMVQPPTVCPSTAQASI